MDMNNAFAKLMEKMNITKGNFETLVEKFNAAGNNLQETIEYLELIESVQVQLLEDLEVQSKEYNELKDEIVRKKLDGKFTELQEGLKDSVNKFLKSEELESKATETIKRNTTKKNVDKRIAEIQIELDMLDKEKGENKLTDEQKARHEFLYQLLDELCGVSVSHKNKKENN